MLKSIESVVMCYSSHKKLIQRVIAKLLVGMQVGEPNSEALSSSAMRIQSSKYLHSLHEYWLLIFPLPTEVSLKESNGSPSSGNFNTHLRPALPSSQLYLV